MTTTQTIETEPTKSAARIVVTATQELTGDLNVWRVQMETGNQEETARRLNSSQSAVSVSLLRTRARIKAGEIIFVFDEMGENSLTDG